MKKLEQLKKQLWFHEQMENKSMVESLKGRIAKIENKLNKKTKA